LTQLLNAFDFLPRQVKEFKNFPSPQWTNLFFRENVLRFTSKFSQSTISNDELMIDHTRNLSTSALMLTMNMMNSWTRVLSILHFYMRMSNVVDFFPFLTSTE
jgi:hypothetical protein